MEGWTHEGVIDRLTAERDRLKAENEKLRKGLEDFRDFGLRHDTCPTTGSDWNDFDWYGYLESADKSVRTRAKDFLNGADPRAGSLPVPQAKCEAAGSGSTPPAPTTPRAHTSYECEGGHTHESGACEYCDGGVLRCIVCDAADEETLALPCSGKKPRQHTLFRCLPGRCQNEGHCQFCDGGLALCTVCKGAEGTLPTHCPGVRMNEWRQELVYAAKIDYRHGRWIVKRHGATP